MAKENSLFDRSLRASLVMGGLAALFAAVYAGPRYGGVYGLAFLWSWVNFRLWGFGLNEFFSRRRPLPMLFLGTAKIWWLAVLLGLAYWARIGEWGNFLAFFLGFGTPVLVMFLKSLGQMLNSQSRDAKSGPDSGGARQAERDND